MRETTNKIEICNWCASEVERKKAFMWKGVFFCSGSCMQNNKKECETFMKKNMVEA